MPNAHVTWLDVGKDRDYAFQVSAVLTDPSICEDDGKPIPFVLVIECLDWAATVGVQELQPAELRYFKKHGAVWISCLHIIPELPIEKIKQLDVPDYAHEFPLYAVDAARYGYGCPVMPLGSAPGTAVWSSKSCPDAETATVIAQRHAERVVIPHLDDILAQPVNQIGELAENHLYQSIDPNR
jgi:hypothetical protein